MMNSFCTDQVNGFRHLRLELGGLEDDYDLGFKFENMESDKFRLDSTTGVKAWAEPLLLLYVSVTHRSSPRSSQTLRYGLTRSKFARGLTSNPDDSERLPRTAPPPGP